MSKMETQIYHQIINYNLQLISKYYQNVKYIIISYQNDQYVVNMYVMIKIKTKQLEIMKKNIVKYIKYTIHVILKKHA